MKQRRILLFDLMFVIIMMLLGALSFFSYDRINNLNRQTERIDRTNIVKLRLEQTLSHVRDAEARQRFFLLTNDSAYVLPDEVLDRRNSDNLRSLDSLMTENPQQRRNFEKLKRLIDIRLMRLKLVTSISRTRGAAAASLLAAGKDVMNEINELISEMLQIEDTTLKERNNKRNYQAFITPLSSLLLSVFAIFVVSISYFLLRTEILQRFRAESDFARLNNYFKDLPALFAIVKGPEHMFELANDAYEQLAGRGPLRGKTYRQVFPQLAGMGFYERIDRVYKTGESIVGKEVPVTLDGPTGEKRTRYFNFVYQPVFEKKQVTGILIFGHEITEMIEVRKKIEETELRSRLAIEAADIGTYDWDLEHEHFESSPRLLEIFGHDRDETGVRHETLLQTFHPEDRPLRDKAIETSFTNGTLRYEARIFWPDGSIHWVNVHGKIVYDAARKPLRMYGTALDITAQKRIMEELMVNEAKFRLLADSMPQIVWTSDVHGKLDYFNKAMLDYSGETAGVLASGGSFAIVHPEDRDASVEAWRRALESGEEFICEHRLRNVSGEYRWQYSRAIPQKDANGNIQRWVGTSSDIQDQKNYAQELEQQINERTEELRELNKDLVIRNNIFAQAEENALIGSYTWSLATGTMEYSDNLFRLFGFEPQAFVPTFEKYLSMIHPDDKEQAMQDGMETLRTRKLVAHVYRIVTNDGKLKHFRSTGKFIGEQNNVSLIGTVQDISQDVLLNEALRVKNIELERINAELESFNYIASHDLQEPLRKIQAFSQRITQMDGQRLSPQGMDYFQRINSAAARMQDLINALLSYSKADAPVEEIKPLDLNVVVSQVETDLQAAMEEKEATIDLETLPVISGVEVQVHQLFSNILSNAIKYSKQGLAPHITITSALLRGIEITNESADKHKNYFRITVADNGIGFEQEYEQKIFELFQRLHNTENYNGTGIGLAICKKIMQNHQGFIAAHGRPGVGSSFELYFPSPN